MPAAPKQGKNDVEPESDEETPKQAEPEEPTEWVMFLSRPGIRLISASDWDAAGVKDHADTRWDFFNDWRVKREDLGLTDEQYSRIILADTGFRVSRELVVGEE